MLFVLLTLTIIRDVIWCFLYIFNKTQNPFTTQRLTKINLITFIFALIVAIISLCNGIKTPKIKKINISSYKITQQQKIILLTDLHLNRILSVKKLTNIVNKTNLEQPDVILLGGDIIDDNINKITTQLNILSNLKAKNGIYFVAGNHETYNGINISINTLKRLGFIFLENSGISLNNEIYLAGIPDIHSSTISKKRYNLQQSFLNSTETQFKILLSHTPAQFKNNNFDLELAGHTHGGQVIPYIFFIYIHTKYIAGLYNIDSNSKLYISRGAGQGGAQMRLFAPSEITIINLKPTTGEVK